MRAMKLLPLLLFALTPFLAGWTFLGDNILGHSYDYVTVRTPTNGDVLMYRSSDGKWIAGSAASSTADASVSVKGLTRLSINPASPTAPIAVGVNDPTVNPTPTAANAGNIPVVPAGGGAYVHINPPTGTDTFLASTGDALAPAFRVIAQADIDELLSLSDLTNVGPMTEAVGDILYVDSIGPVVWTRLPKSTDGMILTLASGKPSWAAASGVADASVVVKGATALSINPASATAPIAVGMNDPTVNPTPTSANQGKIPVVPTGGGAYTHVGPGTTTTVLHGNAAGVPTYGVVTASDANTTITDRLNPTPATQGTIPVDAGSGAYGRTAQGSTNTLLHGVGAGTPTWSKLVASDVTGATLTATEMASSVTNRLMVTPATVGRISVDGGSGAAAVALAQGTSGYVLQSAGAGANPAFNAMSGTGTTALSNTAPVITDMLGITGQAGNPGTFTAGFYSYDTTKKDFKDSSTVGVLTRGGTYSVQIADSAAIASTAAETAFDTLPPAFPANTLTAGRVIRWRAKYLYSNTGAPTYTIKWKLGSTIIADSGAGWVTPTGVTNAIITSSGELTIRSIATPASTTYDSNVETKNDNFGAASAASVIGGPTGRFGSPAATFDATASQQLTDTWTWSASSSSNTIKRVSLVVEVR